MKKVLIYSIQPEHVLNFLNGRKTDEIRKRDLPQWAKEKIDRGEVVEGYGYCTMGYPLLNHIDDKYELMDRKNHKIFHDIGMYEFYSGNIHLNGLVVFKFEVSGVTQFEFVENNLMVDYDNEAQLLGKAYMLNEQATQLTYEQLFKYIGNNKGYAHHFTNIQPIEPMEIGEFYKLEPEIMYNNEEGVSFKHGGYVYIPLTKAPQSFMTAWVKGE